MAANPYDPTQNLGFGAPPGAPTAGQTPTNPYLPAQLNAIQQQATQGLNLSTIPGINSDAVAAGGYGGSRQAVAQGVATGLTNQGVSNADANLLGTAYQNDQSNALAGSQINNNFYTQQRQLDQNGAALGSNLTAAGTTGDLSQGQGITAVGTTQQNAPYTTIDNASNVLNQYTGLGGTAATTANGSTLGALTGGAVLGSTLINNLGLGSTPTDTSSIMPPAGSNDPNSPNYIGPLQQRNGGPVRFADGGSVRFEPVVGSRSPLPSSGNSPMGSQALLAAILASKTPQITPNLGMGSLTANPVTDPQAILAAQMKAAGQFADGGPVWGPGSQRSDSIPARLSNGEHVMDARSVTAIGGGNNDRGQAMLNSMRSALRGA